MGLPWLSLCGVAAYTSAGGIPAEYFVAHEGLVRQEAPIFPEGLGRPCGPEGTQLQGPIRPIVRSAVGNPRVSKVGWGVSVPWGFHGFPCAASPHIRRRAEYPRNTLWLTREAHGALEMSMGGIPSTSLAECWQEPPILSRRLWATLRTRGNSAPGPNAPDCA